LDENKNESQRVNDELTDSEAVDFSNIKRKKVTESKRGLREIKRLHR